MKKVLICMIAIFCISNSFIDVQAVAVNYNVVSKKSSNERYYDYNGIRLSYYTSQIDNFWYTGREYIYRDRDDDGYWCYKKSDDMVSWEMIPKTDGIAEISRHPTNTYSINYWGDRYIVFNRIHEENATAISGVQNGNVINTPLIILDSNFNLVGQQSFDAPISAVSYVDGRYYAETKDYSGYQVAYDFEPIKKVYVSDDAITWVEQDIFTEVPLGNGKSNSLILNGESPDVDPRYIKNVLSVSEKEDISNNTTVIFEKEQSRFYKVVDDIYISWNYGAEEDCFQISLDGIYWLDINYPKFLMMHDVYSGSNSDTIIESVWDCIGLKDKILFQTKYRLFEYDLNDLRVAWWNAFNESQTYIKLNGSYLGFETAPVIEDGSTLVPMRFLFEQMGADVEWNQETQTATATLNNTAVTFSIDDTEASVNNAPTTMDVPARLINDKTMVPLRFLSEEMGYTVTWDDASRTAIIE